jgi:hypothetical protein
VAQDAIVLQDQLHLLRAQSERQQYRQMLWTRNNLLLHRLIKQFFQIIV